MGERIAFPIRKRLRMTGRPPLGPAEIIILPVIHRAPITNPPRKPRTRTRRKLP